MKYILAVHENRPKMAAFPEATQPGKWRWSLVGPAPQTKDESQGSAVEFAVDEAANPGEYICTIQRLDANGASLGGYQATAPMQIPPVAGTVDIEVASALTATVTDEPNPMVEHHAKK